MTEHATSYDFPGPDLIPDFTLDELEMLQQALIVVDNEYDDDEERDKLFNKINGMIEQLQKAKE